MTLKELRKNKGLTQRQAAVYVGVPERTFFNYETDPQKQSSIKYKYIFDKLFSYGYIDEETGVLTVEQIRSICIGVFKKYKVNYCYLFGPYAKGKATETSDVDLFVYTEETGLRFFGLVEELRTALNKRVDLLNQEQIEYNCNLVDEILRYGIKIFG